MMAWRGSGGAGSREQGGRGQGAGEERATEVIALTAQALPNDRDAAFAAGCDAHISKPFRTETLLGAMAKQLGIWYLCAGDESAADWRLNSRRGERSSGGSSG